MGGFPCVFIMNYLDGIIFADCIMVRGDDDKPNSPFYSYLFTNTGESAKKPARILVHSAALNSKDTGIDQKYKYTLVVSDCDGTNLRRVGASGVKYGHFKYIGDNIYISVAHDTWVKEGYCGY